MSLRCLPPPVLSPSCLSPHVPCAVYAGLPCAELARQGVVKVGVCRRGRSGKEMADDSQLSDYSKAHNQVRFSALMRRGVLGRAG